MNGIATNTAVLRGLGLLSFYVHDYLEKNSTTKIPIDIISLFNSMIYTRLTKQVKDGQESSEGFEKVKELLGSVQNFCEVHCKETRASFIDLSVFDNHLKAEIITQDLAVPKKHVI